MIAEEQSASLNPGRVYTYSVTLYPGVYRNYLAHRAVITPQKETTKVVLDASAKHKKASSSLNGLLLQGPVILADLLGLLLHLRLHKIVILTDIEKAFLQVGFKWSEWDVTRFFGF
ncbi:MAG: hypothetical protein GY696_03110 [Gammaproteobacteria bacterium]|nr:hypothetical protein [Gammaproteobacteria bacterium]